MKNLKLILAYFLFGILFTACDSTDPIEPDLATEKLTQKEILSVLLEPNVAANTGVRVDGVLTAIFNSDRLSLNVLNAIREGALDDAGTLELNTEQIEMIFGTNDLASIPNTVGMTSGERGCFIYIDIRWCDDNPNFGCQDGTICLYICL